MNATENRLREALDGGAGTVRQEDLSPLVVRRAPSRVRRRVLTAATAAGLAVAAAGVLLWPTPSPMAAAWSATPQQADQDLIAQLGVECLSMDESRPAGHPVRPAIVDLRGNSAVVVLDLRAEAGRYAAITCSFVGIERTASWQKYVAGNGSLHDAPIEPVGDSVLTLESMSSSAVQGDALSEVSGLAGPMVDHVVVTLEDGTELRATVKDGWYVAWWPEKSTGLFHWGSRLSDVRRPALIRAYDANGTLLKQFVPEGVPGR